MDVAVGNIQQISYISQTEQHSPFGLMLLRLGNVTIMCVASLSARPIQHCHLQHEMHEFYTASNK